MNKEEVSVSSTVAGAAAGGGGGGGEGGGGGGGGGSPGVRPRPPRRLRRAAHLLASWHIPRVRRGVAIHEPSHFGGDTWG